MRNLAFNNEEKKKKKAPKINYFQYFIYHIIIIIIPKYVYHIGGKVHSPKECEYALELGATIIMVNNWDRFEGQWYPNQAETVRRLIPDNVISIAAGGIGSSEQVSNPPHYLIRNTYSPLFIFLQRVYVCWNIFFFC
jgi:hypothetical protein